MRVKISYQYDDNNNSPHFWAISEVPGDKIYSGGDSWEEARKRHMEKLRRLPEANCPPNEEEVEI